VQPHLVDVATIVAYLVAMLVAGAYMSRRAAKNLDAYFLGGKQIPWFLLSVSNAAGMFDISGTMWLVYLVFVYGMKSVFIPWIWPLFNQVFLMVYLAVWLRRSNVLTGAEWITTRFDQDTRGGRLAHLVVVVFSLVSAIGFLAYGFVGIGKFAKIFMPWDWSPHVYAIIVTLVTGAYVVHGGMFGVVLTDLVQYALMTFSAIVIAVIAMDSVDSAMIAAATPPGWGDLGFGWRLDLDWSRILASVDSRIASDGYSLFTVFIMMAVFKGLFVSMGGPVATQALQRILAARNTRDAALVNAFGIIVVSLPRYLMVGGLTALALTHLNPQLKAMGANLDFELILPFAIKHFIPVGLLGLILAGMLSAHMSTVAAFINLAPAIIVNDIYRKYINPRGSERSYVRVSYVVSAAVVVLSIAFGLVVESVDRATQWIVSALWAGSAAANVLKWHWWRFNSYGYFWGMLAGLLIALGLPTLLPHTQPLYAYPYVLAISGFGSILGTLLTRPEKQELLVEFYTCVRPWGFWKPIREIAKARDPGFQENRDFGRDMVNVVVGTVWQVSLTAAPLALVIKHWTSLELSLMVAVVTSVFLWKNWYQKLEGVPVRPR
jgi:SSS family solute:Na+ symporter